MKSNKIAREIKTVLKMEAKRIGKEVTWFRFAKKTRTGGWEFLANKEAQLNKLEEIAIKISGRHKNCTTGEVVDIMSEIVNQ